jgi:hypothetical protein
MNMTTQAPKTETMFVRETMHGWQMSASGNAHIGTFNTLEAAKAFCADMGYRLQITRAGGKIEWS